MSELDRLMEGTVDSLRRTTGRHDAVLKRAVPQGTQYGGGAIDQAWRGLHAAQPELRALEDEAIGALRDLYSVHEDYQAVREAIENADAQWIDHAIFNRASESAVREKDTS